MAGLFDRSPVYLREPRAISATANEHTAILAANVGCLNYRGNCRGITTSSLLLFVHIGGFIFAINIKKSLHFNSICRGAHTVFSPELKFVPIYFGRLIHTPFLQLLRYAHLYGISKI